MFSAMRYLPAIILLLCHSLCITAAKKEEITIVITNPLNSDRLQETVELPLRDLTARLSTIQGIPVSSASIIITDAEGREIPSQVTSDGKLIFRPAPLKARERRVCHARISPRKEYGNMVFGRLFPERQEDFSFENDRVAYRLYGPETQRKGEKLYGYDIFNKRTTALFLDELYADQTDAHMWHTFNRLQAKGMKQEATALYMAFCYHIDHGKGMDCYKVGPTLGAGTNAIMSQSRIFYPWCFRQHEILDNGPLRLSVSLDYGESNIMGIKVSEKRILTLDAGSNMVKAEVCYSIPGQETMPDGTEVCCGIVIHDENPEAYILDSDNGIMAYEDLGDVSTAWEGFRDRQAKEMGRIFIGTYVPAKSLTVEMLPESGIRGVKGHVISRRPFPRDGRFTYFFGSGWDRNPATAFPTLEQWHAYLTDFSRQQQTPLHVKIR